MDTPTSLRKCQYCGLEAHVIEELELFTKGKRYSYGRRNICKICSAKTLRTGGIYSEGHKRAYENWLENNKERHKLSMSKRITMKQKEGFKRIYTNVLPRTGVCSKCGERGHTQIHHDKYDSEHPLENTRELCRSCHISVSNEERREQIKNGERKGWNIP